MSIKNDDVVRLAISIRRDNQSIDAPVNDIVQCIKQLRESGLETEKIRTAVPTMFSDDENQSQQNENRVPNRSEILVYDLPEEYLALLEDPK